MSEPGDPHDKPAGAPEGVPFPRAIRSFVRRAGRTTIGQARAFTISSTQQIPIPIYGVVVAQPRALPAGLYRDTLRVTLDW